MIGLDFPVAPEWIHDVHALWQPEQPVTDLVQRALRQTMQELGGERTRAHSLTIILRYFVGTVGGGNSRVTLPEDIWVRYSRTYPVNVMAPAYLAHLIAQNEVAQTVTGFFRLRHAPGDEITSSDVQRLVIAKYGQRKVVTNAASAFLRTLQRFHVLEDGAKMGTYRFLGLLSVEQDIFPLLVWSWWQAHLEPQIDLDAFQDDPALTFLEKGHLDGLWEAHQPALWSLEARIEGRRATLRYADRVGFEGALLEQL